MLDRIYLEITNLCNLACTFCHKTAREKKLLTAEEFEALLAKIEGRAKYLFFHLMGEPTLHPLLPQFVEAARAHGFLPTITTNGSLLAERGEALLAARPYKVSISLHAPEANPAFSADGYLDTCIDFAKRAAAGGCLAVLRLWTLGSETDVTPILAALHTAFPGEWRDLRGGSSQQLADRIFLEWGERFDWPDPACPACEPEADRFCYGLRDQIGILVDGTVVPCCLDAEGHLSLGNLFAESLDTILSSPRAAAIYNGFSRRRAVESLCRRCGFAKRFSHSDL